MIIVKKIKILHIISNIDFGGVEKVLENYILNMDSSIFDNLLITHGKSNKECKKQLEKIGIRILKYRLKRKIYIKI